MYMQPRKLAKFFPRRLTMKIFFKFLRFIYPSLNGLVVGVWYVSSTQTVLHARLTNQLLRKKTEYSDAKDTVVSIDISILNMYTLYLNW